MKRKQQKHYFTRKQEAKWYMTIALILIAFILFPLLMKLIWKVMPSKPLVRPIVYAANYVPVEDNQEMISYIKTIFGKDWRTAVAVATAESHLKQSARLVTDREWSVCIFQINLKAHGAKVPGKDLEAKQLWLVSDVRNCILIAKSIFADSGFYPWSAYTSGRYLAYLNK